MHIASLISNLTRHAPYSKSLALLQLVFYPHHCHINCWPHSIVKVHTDTLIGIYNGGFVKWNVAPNYAAGFKIPKPPSGHYLCPLKAATGLDCALLRYRLNSRASVHKSPKAGGLNFCAFRMRDLCLQFIYYLKHTHTHRKGTDKWAECCFCTAKQR